MIIVIRLFVDCDGEWTRGRDGIVKVCSDTGVNSGSHVGRFSDPYVGRSGDGSRRDRRMN